MGCCVTRIGVLNEFPFEEIEEFNRLKIEIVQILNNKEDINYEDNNQILELINRINIKIAKSEEIIDNLKNKKRLKPQTQTIREIIQGIKSNIKELEEYNKFLNFQIKKNKNDINIKSTLKKDIKQKQIEIITEENTLNNKSDDNINNDNQLKSKKDLNTKPIYYKKTIINSKYSGIFNKNKKYIKTNNNSSIIIYNRNKGNNSINNNIFKNKTSISTLNEEKNKININFILEDGNIIALITDIKDKFINLINKLGEENEEYNNIEKMVILDGNDDITNKVKNQEVICDFGFEDNHFIKLKIK